MKKTRVASLLGPCAGSPEESLEVLRELCAASVARVHGDEDSHRRIQADLLPKEVEPLLLVSDCILNAFDLVSESTEKVCTMF